MQIRGWREGGTEGLTGKYKSVSCIGGVQSGGQTTLCIGVWSQTRPIFDISFTTNYHNDPVILGP